MSRIARLGRASALIGLLLLPVGCQKTYYNVLEQVGIEKRELLTRRVTSAKESQEEAQEEFRDALTGHGMGCITNIWHSMPNG